MDFRKEEDFETSNFNDESYKLRIDPDYIQVTEEFVGNVPGYCSLSIIILSFTKEN